MQQQFLRNKVQIITTKYKISMYSPILARIYNLIMTLLKERKKKQIIPCKMHVRVNCYHAHALRAHESATVPWLLLPMPLMLPGLCVRTVKPRNSNALSHALSAQKTSHRKHYALTTKHYFLFIVRFSLLSF